jgi:hypothetical protein
MARRHGRAGLRRRQLPHERRDGSILALQRQPCEPHVITHVAVSLGGMIRNTTSPKIANACGCPVHPCADVDVRRSPDVGMRTEKSRLRRRQAELTEMLRARMKIVPVEADEGRPEGEALN